MVTVLEFGEGDLDFGRGSYGNLGDGVDFKRGGKDKRRFWHVSWNLIKCNFGLFFNIFKEENNEK